MSSATAARRLAEALDELELAEQWIRSTKTENAIFDDLYVNWHLGCAVPGYSQIKDFVQRSVRADMGELLKEAVVHYQQKVAMAHLGFLQECAKDRLMRGQITDFTRMTAPSAGGDVPSPSPSEQDLQTSSPDTPPEEPRDEDSGTPAATAEDRDPSSPEPRIRAGDEVHPLRDPFEDQPVWFVVPPQR